MSGQKMPRVDFIKVKDDPYTSVIDNGRLIWEGESLDDMRWHYLFERIGVPFTYTYASGSTEYAR